MRAEKLCTPEYLSRHPILLLGGGGTLGCGINRALVEQYGPGAVQIASRGSGLEVDITDFKSVESLIRGLKPSLIVHLAAATDVNGCERDPEMAFEVNVEGTRQVLRAAENTPVVYLSTDFVFDGARSKPYTETDMPNPLSVYGHTKWVSEAIFMDSDNPGFIARVSFPRYPVSAHVENQHLKDTLWWFGSQLVSGKDVSAYTNVVGSWTPADRLAANFFALSHKMIHSGRRLIHLACCQPASAYDVAVQLRECLAETGKFGEQLGQVIPVEFKAQEGVSAARPVKGGLDVSLATKLGFDFGQIDSSIQRDWLDVDPEQLAAFGQ